VDGEFWHGHKLSEERMQYMAPYWQEKIARNVARDARVNSELVASGWTVVRFGERDVRRRLKEVADEIEHKVRSTKFGTPE
jgi:DNA mismatch endonuclease (patch repair protein)